MKKRTTRMISFLIAALMFFTTVVSGTSKEAFAATATKEVVEEVLVKYALINLRKYLEYFNILC